MNFKKRFFLALLFTAFFTQALMSDLSTKDIFSDPCICTSEEWEKELKAHDFDMCFHYRKDTYLKFNCTQDKVYFEIALGEIPEEYLSLLEGLKEEFDLKYFPETNQYLFSYEINNNGQETFNHFIAQQDNHHAESPGYVVADRRVLEGASPKEITEADLQRILKEHDVLFYTGAGLSVAANIPDMQKLVELLEIEANENFLPSLVPAFENPKEFAEKILQFHQACMHSIPTDAHQSLKDLAIAKNSRILTENLDCLHELTGIRPYRIQPNQLKKEGLGEALKKYDYLICIGLSYDDRGFISWYKHKNPEGKIISIDLKQPSYLGDDDFLLVGDLQKILPHLQL